MKSNKRLSCVLAVLLTALCVHAETITYDFDDATLQGWVNEVKAGREFVCWDTAADVTGDTQSVPADLQLATTYYWKVTEVNEADATAARQGKVWSFTTEAFVAVDDFESYTDEEGQRIYQFWEDGYVNGTGSTAGYFEAPFAEKEIVRSGRQAMPLFYEGTSEVDLTLTDGQDWTAHGVQSLGLYFYGDTESSGGQFYIKINGTRIDCDGSIVDILQPAWQLWTVDLSAVGNVTDVETLTIGVEGAGASGVVYVDDIRLY